MPELVTNENYARKLQEFLNNQVAIGAMTANQAMMYWQQAATTRQTALTGEKGAVSMAELPFYREMLGGAKGTGVESWRQRAEAATNAVQQVMLRRPRESYYQRLRRLEAALPGLRLMGGGSGASPSAAAPNAVGRVPPWVAVDREIHAIRRGLGQEGLEEEEGYAAGTFERERQALSGAKPWQNWFERQYSRELSRFRAVLPFGEQLPGKKWKEYLQERKPELKEEYASFTPYQRGERPRVFQPGIKTVGFG